MTNIRRLQQAAHRRILSTENVLNDDNADAYFDAVERAMTDYMEKQGYKYTQGWFWDQREDDGNYMASSEINVSNDADFPLYLDGDVAIYDDGARIQWDLAMSGEPFIEYAIVMELAITNKNGNIKAKVTSYEVDKALKKQMRSKRRK